MVASIVSIDRLQNGPATLVDCQQAWARLALSAGCSGNFISILTYVDKSHHQQTVAASERVRRMCSCAHRLVYENLLKHARTALGAPPGQPYTGQLVQLTILHTTHDPMLHLSQLESLTGRILNEQFSLRWASYCIHPTIFTSLRSLLRIVILKWQLKATNYNCIRHDT